MNEEIEEDEETNAKNRQVFDPIDKNYDARKRRVTDPLQLAIAATH